MGEAEAVEAKGGAAAEEEGGGEEDGGGGVRGGPVGAPTGIPGPKSGTWGTRLSLGLKIYFDLTIYQMINCAKSPTSASII